MLFWNAVSNSGRPSGASRLADLPFRKPRLMNFPGDKPGAGRRPGGPGPGNE